MKEDMIS